MLLSYVSNLTYLTHQMVGTAVLVSVVIIKTTLI